LHTVPAASEQSAQPRHKSPQCTTVAQIGRGKERPKARYDSIPRQSNHYRRAGKTIRLAFYPHKPAKDAVLCGSAAIAGVTTIRLLLLRFFWLTPRGAGAPPRPGLLSRPGSPPYRRAVPAFPLLSRVRAAPGDVSVRHPRPNESTTERHCR
jgi:hypothetical protein